MSEIGFFVLTIIVSIVGGVFFVSSDDSLPDSLLGWVSLGGLIVWCINAALAFTGNFISGEPGIHAAISHFSIITFFAFGSAWGVRMTNK